MRKNKSMAIISVLFIVVFTCVIPQALPAAIPNLIGTWEGSYAFVDFENILDPTSQPRYFSGNGPLFCITHQRGRLFAGHTFSDEIPEPSKLTGVIGIDNTIYIQNYSGGSTRRFYYGKIYGKGKQMKIKGTVHGYEDVNISTFPAMGSGYFEAKKQTN